MNPHRYQVEYRGRVDGAIHCVRSIAVLYYFNNPKWTEGDGGESSMYKEYKGEPVRKIGPVNNRLFAFEVSPQSFHTFMRNKNIRNSLVMWYHSPEPYMIARYGEEPK
jgi:Rps23 Pro-64 3,4-dihydroxylase Tpa1-like proline 4-hydroxylase